MTLKIKVCGMRNPENIRRLTKLNPDFIGFIFHPQSKRFIGEQITDEIKLLIPKSIRKIGVFVDEPFESLIEKFRISELDMVQLHGHELPEYCQRLRDLHISVIKAFSISHEFDFGSVQPYENACDYYLFDTAGVLSGGNGLKFDWKKLKQYQGTKPFFLSGGIHLSDIPNIKSLVHEKLYAVDVNSGFEAEPGMKDILQLKSFINDLRNNQI